MPPKKGGKGDNNAVQNGDNGMNLQDALTATAGDPETMAVSLVSRTKVAAKTKNFPRTKADAKVQSKFNIAPLILEGVKLNKLQLNDVIKQHLKDLRISDIQLSKTGIFTLYASDVSSFNRLLNELTSVLATNGQATAKIYVPRSIQRIQDTEKVAFVKNVDIEIPEGRITEALKHVGLDVTDVFRLKNKTTNMPTKTLKISFVDAQNRNTFVHTGLQVDCMHFAAEPASQNSKPVQCYICMKYNHIGKYCKTKEQVCARCGENHHTDQCTVANDAVKCHNCKGNHVANSKDCSHYREQEKRMLNMINQYATQIKQATTQPAIHCTKEFPPLPNAYQQQKEMIENNLIDDILNRLTSKMEKIIEETTNRIFKTLEKKIKAIEKSISSNINIETNEDALIISDSDSNDESQIVKYIKNKQQHKSDTANSTTSIATTTKPTTTTNSAIGKPPRKQKEKSKSTKRARSPNSSLDTSTSDNKDLKTSNNED